MTDELKNSILSSQRDQKLTSELEKLRAFVRENGVKPDLLAVFLLSSNEMIMGETYSDDLLPKWAVEVRNPKRYLRLQQVSNQGLSINLMLTDLDALTGEGMIHIRAVAAYWVKEQSLEGQIGTLSLFQQYFKLRAANRATEAGLVLPPSLLTRG